MFPEINCAGIFFRIFGPVHLQSVNYSSLPYTAQGNLFRYSDPQQLLKASDDHTSSILPEANQVVFLLNLAWLTERQDHDTALSSVSISLNTVHRPNSWM